ncbi:MAG: hypothetical protein ACE5K8_08750 [Candidatus Zixiibacteriota bacterium]
MKAISSLLLFIAISSQTLADTPDLIYLQIEPMIGDRPALSDAGITGGCYIGYGKECKGMFYIDDDGSGVLVGSIINDLVSTPNFELLYSMTLSKEEGRDMLVGSAYAMQLSPEGEILGGRRTEIRQYFTYGEEIVLAQPVGRLPNGENIFLQMSANTQKSKSADKSAEHPITLISTQLVDGEPYSQVKHWYNSLRADFAFRTGFKSKENNNDREYEFLKYEVEIDVDCDIDIDIGFSSDADRDKEPLKGQLFYRRKYTIDTLHHALGTFSPDVVYTSKYTKDIGIVPGKMLKLIFPPDTPSVRGFDIEDTLIIVPQ